MTTITTSSKLKHLKWLRPGDGVSQVDFNDVQGWLRRAGPNFDVSVLCDLDRARIESIWAQFFQEAQ